MFLVMSEWRPSEMSQGTALITCADVFPVELAGHTCRQLRPGYADIAALVMVLQRRAWRRGTSTV
jgi:hypothetical protein